MEFAASYRRRKTSIKLLHKNSAYIEHLVLQLVINTKYTLTKGIFLFEINDILQLR